MEGPLQQEALRELARSPEARAIEERTSGALDAVAGTVDRLPPVLRAGVSLLSGVPVLGAALQLLTDRATGRRLDRLEQLAEDTAALVREVQADSSRRFDWDFVRSDAYAEMLAMAIESANRSPRPEKVRLLAQALVGGAVQSAYSPVFRGPALRWVAELQVEHMLVLRVPSVRPRRSSSPKASTPVKRTIRTGSDSCGTAVPTASW
jgi:hypothetical protein